MTVSRAHRLGARCAVMRGAITSVAQRGRWLREATLRVPAFRCVEDPCRGGVNRYSPLDMNGAWEKLADGNENGQQDYGADKTRLTTFTYPSLADKRTLNMVNAKFLGMVSRVAKCRN